MAIGDLNGDGKPDLAVADAGANEVTVLLGKGDGTFQAAQNFPTGILSYCPPTVSGSFGKADENIWQCVPWETPHHAVMSTCQKETVMQSQE